VNDDPFEGTGAPDQTHLRNFSGRPRGRTPSREGCDARGSSSLDTQTWGDEALQFVAVEAAPVSVGPAAHLGLAVRDTA